MWKKTNLLVDGLNVYHWINFDRSEALDLQKTELKT